MINRNRPSAPVYNAERGATFIEFALSVGVIMMFIIMGTDLIRFGYFTVTTQQVLNRAARLASTGTTGDNPDSKKTPAERAKDIEQLIIRVGSVFGVDLRGSDITICPLPRADAPAPPCPPNNAGTHKDFIQITLQRPFYFFWGGIQFPMRLNAIAKNEPF